MEYRELPGTGLRVSRACLGTMTFGGQADAATSAQLLDTSLDRGINFVDTANVYNNGESERILGELLGARRKDIVLASKVAMKVGDEQPGLSRKAVESAVEQSLQRLRTEYLDIYYLHTPDYQTPVEETLGALDSLVKAGKVRYAATSNYASWQVAQMLCLSERMQQAAPKVAQPMYNLLARRIEDEFLPMCQAYGIGTVAYNPLAGGLLTGKHEQQTNITPGTRFDNNKAYQDRYWNEANFQAVTKLADVARHANRSLISMSLNWLLHHTPIDCVILGASRLDQLTANLDALEQGPLSKETVAACDAVWPPLKGTAPKYNR